jgi:predicted RNA methylase
LDAFERALNVAKRRETTEILVLTGSAELLRRSVDDPDPRVQQVFQNPHFQRLIPIDDLPMIERFFEGIYVLCRKHHATTVDVWSVPVVDMMGDGIHPGRATVRLQAAVICDAIARQESAYASAPFGAHAKDTPNENR